MRSRRSLLTSAAALVTAGCTARPSPSTGRTTSTASTASTAAPRTTSASPPSPTPAVDCAETTVRTPPEATVSDDDVTPPTYPAFPERLDADAAAAFASEYERAYTLNELLATTAGVEYVDVAVSDSPPVTETDRGFVVDLAYTYAVEAGTPADYPPRHVAYLVRAGVVARAELDADAPAVPFPVARADVFRCDA